MIEVNVTLVTSGFCEVYQVRSSDGVVGFFKLFGANRSDWVRLSALCSFLLSLGECGCRVSKPLELRPGEKIIAFTSPEGSRAGILFDAAKGREVKYEKFSVETAIQYGEGLGEIHGASQKILSHKQLDLPVFSVGDRLKQARIALELSTQQNVYDFSSLLDCSRIWEVPDLVEQKVVCHGDAHGQNACLADGAFTFFDFEYFGVCEASYDLSTFLWVFLLIRDDRDNAEKLFEGLMSGYQRVVDVKNITLSRFIHYACIRHLWYIALQLELATIKGTSVLNEADIFKLVQRVIDLAATDL